MYMCVCMHVCVCVHACVHACMLVKANDHIINLFLKHQERKKYNPNTMQTWTYTLTA